MSIFKGGRKRERRGGEEGRAIVLGLEKKRKHNKEGIHTIRKFQGILCMCVHACGYFHCGYYIPGYIKFSRVLSITVKPHFYVSNNCNFKRLQEILTHFRAVNTRSAVILLWLEAEPRSAEGNLSILILSNYLLQLSP